MAIIIAATEDEFKILSIGACLVLQILHEKLDFSVELSDELDLAVANKALLELDKELPSCIPLHDLIKKLQTISQVNNANFPPFKHLS